jgi:Cellulase (glycosyl hydrolase family 5)
LKLKSRRWGVPLIAFLLAFFVLPIFASPPTIRAAGANFGVSNGRIVDKNGNPFFIVGVNYEGHTDRAWRMWEYDFWNVDLIDANLWLAKGAGINTVRIFIQKPLRDEMYYGNFTRLDKMFELAKKHGLYLLVTFQDYFEPEITKERDLNLKIAQRYLNHPNLFGYDLKNEPQLVDIATPNYPGDVPLQADGFIKTYGERITQAEVNNWRQTYEGKGLIPNHLDERRGYLYANVYRLHNDMLAAAYDFVRAHPGSNLLDFIDSSASQYWREYLSALNATLQKWLEVRIGAIRQVDQNVLITVGWNDPFLAKSRANQLVNFISYHRFVPEGIWGIRETLNMLANLRGHFPGQPVILEEFGYSNHSLRGNALTQGNTASHETLLWLALYSQGYSGGFKWMLTNFTRGQSPYEGNFGLLDDNTNPKSTYHALKAVASYIAGRPPVTGKLTWYDGNDYEVFYNYRDNEAIFANFASDPVGLVKWKQAANDPLAVWWNAATGQVNLIASAETTVSFEVELLFPGRSRSSTFILTADGQAANFEQSGALIHFTAAPNRLYNLSIPNRPPAFQPVAPLPNTLFFKETGHNLKGAFRTYWERNGGLARYGFPLSEEFVEKTPQDGKTYVVQYFERARFEYHPENSAPYDVLLGHLGRTITAGRENEPAFQAINAISSVGDKLYFRENGHSLGGTFRAYWEQNGGLAQFGLPISEEFSELNPADGKTYVVQYFERARFEYHPENKPENRVLLGLLGWQVVRAKGWL